MAALLGEAYCLAALSEDLISMLGIGLVVLIAGYLLLDSIRFEVEKYFIRVEEENERKREETTKLQKGLFMALNQNLEEYFKQMKK